MEFTNVEIRSIREREFLKELEEEESKSIIGGKGKIFLPDKRKERQLIGKSR